MTNVQLYLAVGVPLLLTIITLGSNVALYVALSTKTEKALSDQSTKTEKALSDLNAKVDKVLMDLNMFYRELGRHDKAIELLERPRG